MNSYEADGGVKESEKKTRSGRPLKMQRKSIIKDITARSCSILFIALSAITCSFIQKPNLINNTIMVRHTYDDEKDNGWMAYDYEIIEEIRYDGFNPVTLEDKGGVNESGHIWTDDSRWGIDIPDGGTILALSVAQGGKDSYPKNLTGAIIKFYVKGDNLNLNGGTANLYIYDGITGTTTHYIGKPFKIVNGKWTEVVIPLLAEELLWFRSWWRTKFNSKATADEESFLLVSKALRQVSAIGIAFRGFSREASGILRLDDVRIEIPERRSVPASNAKNSGADLSYRNLAGRNLRKINLSGAILVGTDFTNADLTNANLAGADATAAVFENATLDGAILTNAILQRANLTQASLVGAELSRADIRWAQGNATNFNNATMRLALFEGANLFHCYFNNANVEGITARESKFRACVFRNIRARSSDFSSADLSRSDLSNADLTMAKLNSTDLRFANLHNANLFETNLTDADLFRARLINANIISACFNNANLKYSTWVDGTVHK